MVKIYISRKFHNTLVLSGAIILLSLVFSACAGSPSGTGGSGRANEKGRTGEKNNASSLIVQSPQKVTYNGSPQPLSFLYEGEDKPELIYYLSPKNREEERGGSHSAPTLAGTYYVLLRCLNEEVHVEYNIVKCPVKIKAEKIQEAVYNGSPKRVQAEADPPVPLFYSYYPNRELRDAAVKAEEEAASKNKAAQQQGNIYKGYKRIDSAPAEQGTYYVWILFPGDENHEAAQTYIEFTIQPSPAAAPRQR